MPVREGVLNIPHTYSCSTIAKFKNRLQQICGLRSSAKKRSAVMYDVRDPE